MKGNIISGHALSKQLAWFILSNFNGIVHPKINNSVSYSLSCCSKPMCCPWNTGEDSVLHTMTVHSDHSCQAPKTS